jgi:Xaa-Pro aminopeptidase
MMNLEAMQEALRAEQLDGWLFYDHHRRDPLAYRILGLPDHLSVTRRWYYFIPAHGAPRGLVHRIEAHHLDSLPGEKHLYSGWQEQRQALPALLGEARVVAMQHSQFCDIPYVAMVDAGTVDLVRSFGVDVRGSANLVQRFHAQLTHTQYELHLEAGRRMDKLRASAFALIDDRLRNGSPVHEFEVQQFLRDGFAAHGMVTDHGPIVAVNANASDPHYEPSAERTTPIRPGDLVLIDMWAKLREPDAIYYDITWVGYCGHQIPEPMLQVFDLVTGARDAGFALARQRMESGNAPMGFEVDDAVRGHIREAGYADYFIHRTGHSIDTSVHGTGANMDNLETHDTRRLMDYTCFSVEPGIYLPEFGIRSEFNVFVRNGSAETTGEVQRQMLRLGA